MTTSKEIIAMEAIEAGNEGKHLGWMRSTIRMLGLGAVALAGLVLSGFTTEASAQNGSSTIVVRARGTTGAESISLRVDNSTVATWTLSTSLQSFSATTSLTGTVTVA